MAHYIGGDQSICLAVLRHNILRRIGTKESDNGVYSVLASLFRHVGRWFHTQMPNSASGKIFKHDPVIAAEFNNERSIAFQVMFADPGSVLPEMGLHES